MDWTFYSENLWHHQPLPLERKHVLVQIAERPEVGLPAGVAVGYMRFAAGDKHSPVFVVPGIGGPVVAWCDCLPDKFVAPLWRTKTAA